MDLNKYINGADLNRFDRFMLTEQSDTVYMLDESLPTLGELFSGDKYYVFLLIKFPETNIGHWVLLTKFSETKYEYFDCLALNVGKIPDILQERFRQLQVEIVVDFMLKPLMAKDNFICGKYCMFRVMTLPRSLAEFNKFISPLNVSSDKLVNFTINLPYENI